MDDVYAYLVQLPRGINEMIAPCLGGYTVYIDARLTEEARRDAYNHAIGHIARGDFDAGDVQEIEARAHEASA